MAKTLSRFKVFDLIRAPGLNKIKGKINSDNLPKIFDQPRWKSEEYNTLITCHRKNNINEIRRFRYCESYLNISPNLE